MTSKMKIMRHLAASWPAAVACLMLAGCGASTKVLTGLLPTAVVVPVRVAKGTPMIDVTVASLGVAGPMARAALRGDVSEWRSADGVGLTLRGGQIIATRGFGADLAIGDAQGADKALQQGGGTFSRTMHWLDGENHDRAEVLACTLRVSENQPKPSERALSETCVGPQSHFTNSYAVSRATGRLIRLDQWVSPGLGHVIVELR